MKVLRFLIFYMIRTFFGENFDKFYCKTKKNSFCLEGLMKISF